FMVSTERGTYMCFGCNERGDIFSFVQKMDGIDFPTALRSLAERAGVTLERRSFAQQSPEHKQKEERLREACEAAAQFYIDELGKRAGVLKYIEERGVTESTRTSWRIGYAPAQWSALSDYLAGQKGFSKQELVDAGLAVRSQKSDDRVYDRFRGRIMFPISDLSGHVIAFSGRFFEKMKDSHEEGEPAKYVNSPETELFKKSKILYGLDKAKGFIRKADCILLVEGQFDVVMSHQSGLPFAVAVSGTALTHEHLSLLARFSKRLILALDNDAAGLRAGLRSTAMAYAAGFDVKVPNFGPQQNPVAEPATSEGSVQAPIKDPADLAKENPEALRAAIRNSKTAVEFFLEALRPQARDERSYKQSVELQVLPLIASLQSKIDQEHFIALTANKLSVSADAVRLEVAKRPAAAVIEEEGVSVPSVPELSIDQIERAGAMLIFYCDEDAEFQAKLREILGARYEQIKEKYGLEAERFRFDFEALGEERDVVRDALLSTINRQLIEEEIGMVNRELRAASGAHTSELLKKLSMLKKREQELRN
ncbi:MAG TPA: DNA primase, partial [Candidatus Paceibacterota bacterium]|nr:DNA primase [Candidatus Paceibacterota bacterium]